MISSLGNDGRRGGHLWSIEEPLATWPATLIGSEVELKQTPLDLRIGHLSAWLQEYVASGPPYSETSFASMESTK
jgi:hypothetical protein